MTAVEKWKMAISQISEQGIEEVTLYDIATREEIYKGNLAGLPKLGEVKEVGFAMGGGSPLGVCLYGRSRRAVYICTIAPELSEPLIITMTLKE